MLADLMQTTWIWAGLALGIAAVFALDAHKRESKLGEMGFGSLAAGAGLACLSWPAAEWLGQEPGFGYLLTILAGLVAGILGALLFLREVPQHLSKITQDWTLRSLAIRNSKTDVREIARHFPFLGKDFDPSKFFDKSKGIFIGLDESREPIYISKAAWPRMPHAAITGTSGSGKGVALQGIVTQLVAAGEAVFLVDPKDDEYLPHVMFMACRKAGKPYHIINLRARAPQVALFDGATPDEIEELLIAGFGLNDTGTNADYYALSDRKWSGIVARAIVADGLTPAGAYEKFAEILEEHAEKLGGKLRELAEVPAVNALPGQGVSFRKIIEEGALCYVVGSMRAEKIVRLQRLLAVRIIQIAEARDRLAGDLRPVCLALDEVKYHISRTFLESLGAARDKGIHVILCYQTMADLTDCGSLPPDAVKGAVVENCRLKICYQLQDPDLAEWMAKLTGRILVDVETREVSKNLALTETMAGGRQVRQDERFLIDENMFLNLPKGVGVVFGLGLARFAHISRLTVAKDPAAIEVREVPGEIVTPPELLLDIGGEKDKGNARGRNQPSEATII